jgi:hypothetical protein
VALWSSFEDADGAIKYWDQLRNLIYNRGLDPVLRVKVRLRAGVFGQLRVLYGLLFVATGVAAYVGCVRAAADQ